MKCLIREILRFVSRPKIWYFRWCNAQGNVLENRRLLRKLNAEDSETVFLYGRISVAHPENCRLGHHVSIHDAEWNAEGGISIGNHVHFGADVSILTVSHNYEGQSIPYDSTFITKSVVIEDNVWVGQNVVIAPGTHIEEGCVIAMGATISGRIPKGSIVGAAKWRTLKMRDMDKYETIKGAGKFH